MNLYIQTENGQTVNHPAFEDNLIAAYGGVPDHWKPFVRVERPRPGIYEVLESEQPAYQMINGVWTDVWTVRPMTDEEIAAKHQQDEATLRMVPPIPLPVEEGKIFRWSGADNNWKEAPAIPEGEGQYVFDFAQWIWVSA